jgi:hypothetical protein
LLANINRQLFGKLWLLIALGVAGSLAGCGGGGAAGPGAPTPTGTATPPATSIQLLVSSQQLASSGVGTVDVWAVVLDSRNVAISGSPVGFQVVDPSGTAFMSNVSGGVTDSNGLVIAKLNLGTNKSNRTITLTATSGSAIGTNAVEVTGTKLSISGSSALVLGSTTPLQISLKDAGGNAIRYAQVNILSAKGNPLSPSTGTTNDQGQLTTTVTGSVPGTDTITASGFGTSASQTVSVSGSSFTFGTPAPNAQISVNTLTPIVVNWSENGVLQIGKTVDFSATRGTLSATSAVTDGSGNATVTINSSSTGLSTITASGRVAAPATSPSNAISVLFITNNAASVNVQAGKTTLPINTSGSTSSFSTISATVRDGANNLVKGARVVFQIAQDSTGGSLTVGGVATTDVSGTAAVDYIAGTISSAQNGVVVTATVTDVNGVPVSGVTGSVNLTVGGQSLFVRLQTDNSIVDTRIPNLIKTYSAAVTDAAGNPVPNITVQFTLKPRQHLLAEDYAYYKGYWSWCDGTAGSGCTTAVWQKVITTAPAEWGCYNEDVNYNGILDAGEDYNGNGLLTPGNVAVVTGSTVTDVSGFALAKIEYAKAYAHWAQVTLRATVGGTVAGTESSDTTSFELPGLASDYTSLSSTPPGQPSPFGMGTACSQGN